MLVAGMLNKQLTRISIMQIRAKFAYLTSLAGTALLALLLIFTATQAAKTADACLPSLMDVGG